MNPSHVPAHDHHGLPELHFPDPGHGSARTRVVRSARRASIVLAVLLFAGLARALWAQHAGDAKLADRSAQAAVLHVRTTHPAPSAQEARISLPGSVQSVVEAQIYARASGYLRRWHRDIGDRVHKGDLLAEIEIPEIDPQLRQAQANLDLAHATFERWTLLRTQDAVPQQELDEKAAAYRQAEGDVERLREQVGFARVLAPFDGIVTRRNANVGDLVNAGNGGAASAPLFTMSRENLLHAYVYVPQERAPEVRVAEAVEIVRPERPGEKFAGRIARTAGAIDLATRTLQVDVEIPAGRGLLPGSFIEVRWTPDKSAGGHALLVPASALLFDAAGVSVAVVQDGKVHRRKVLTGTDFGTLVAIRDGVAASDEIIVYPPESIRDGQAVVVAPTP
jgi:multidrug efflux system membrane fusion protein